MASPSTKETLPCFSDNKLSSVGRRANRESSATVALPPCRPWPAGKNGKQRQQRQRHRRGVPQQAATFPFSAALFPPQYRGGTRVPMHYATCDIRAISRIMPATDVTVCCARCPRLTISTGTCVRGLLLEIAPSNLPPRPAPSPSANSPGLRGGLRHRAGQEIREPPGHSGPPRRFRCAVKIAKWDSWKFAFGSDGIAYRLVQTGLHMQSYHVSRWICKCYVYMQLLCDGVHNVRKHTYTGIH